MDGGEWERSCTPALFIASGDPMRGGGVWVESEIVRSIDMKCKYK